MKWLGNLAPWLALAAYQVGAGLAGVQLQVLRPLSLTLALAAVVIVWPRHRRGQAFDLELAVVAYLLLAALGSWLFHETWGGVMADYPATVLYAMLFLTVAVPPWFGREPFTCHFARRQTPVGVWQTELFRKINRHLTGLWAALFAGSALVSLAPHLFPALASPTWQLACRWLAPLGLLWGLGLPLTKWYPSHRQRQLGLAPEPEQPSSLPAAQPGGGSPLATSEPLQKEEEKVSAAYQVVVVNGSPHVGFGNTTQMISLLKEAMAPEGLALEEIFLSRHYIEYCTGCGVCLEKGACWIRDDHKMVVHKLLEADAVILASPVYFRQVTAQMKTFLDRSLGCGHRPRGTWKPGLAVSVSAGWGETEVAQYLAQVLRVYGAFSVGQLTAIAAGPGEFLGLEAVAARAQDLARDLARAVKEKRRYPVTDQYLDYWHFMGHLVKEHQDYMKADHEHWQKLGLYDSFEAYAGQSRAPSQRSPEMRQAWLKGLIAEQLARSHQAAQPETASAPQDPQTARELLQMMPGALNPEVASGLSVTYQFEVSGAEQFMAHLRIHHGQASYHDGPAEKPEVIIKTPADVWLAVARGELDGAQAFMAGKYHVEGDLSLLMKLNSLFSK